MAQLTITELSETSWRLTETETETGKKLMEADSYK